MILQKTFELTKFHSGLTHIYFLNIIGGDMHRDLLKLMIKLAGYITVCFHYR